LDASSFPSEVVIPGLRLMARPGMTMAVQIREILSRNLKHLLTLVMQHRVARTSWTLSRR
jgi:hypothetical protein